MKKSQVISLFEEFIADYSEQQYEQIWRKQSKRFHDFWDKEIANSAIKQLPIENYDPIIRILDTKAKGFDKNINEAVARVYIFQSTWYRIFNDFKEKANLRSLMEKVFRANEKGKLCRAIDELEQFNRKYRNGLTGQNANALNALLFVNKPQRFISCVSLSHREELIDRLGFADTKIYSSYGQRIAYSNEDIINGFKSQYGLDLKPRTLSRFLYYPPFKSLWLKGNQNEPEHEKETINDETQEFYIEQHLEDFLVANWEGTLLGKKYDLIMKEGVPISQQYQTGIGKIDLLVTDKKTKDYAVIELKKGQTSDQTLGQLMRYLGWVKKNLANGKSVKGIIIAGSYDEKLKYALDILPDADIYFYKINFSLERPRIQ